MISGDINHVMDELIRELQVFAAPPSVAVKINLPSPPRTGTVHTDAQLLRHTVSCLTSHGCDVTIVEGADGYLRNNLSLIGLDGVLNNSSVHCLDIDLEEKIIWRELNRRRYPLPNVLADMDMRIAIPCTTKRLGYLFSGNVKTMVGLLPRKLCLNGETSNFSRPMIHEDLTETVSDLFLIVQENMPFRFFINGGNTLSETCEITRFPQYYVGSDPVAMDEYLAGQLNVPLPDYLIRLKEMRCK